MMPLLKHEMVPLPVYCMPGLRNGKMPALSPLFVDSARAKKTADVEVKFCSRHTAAIVLDKLTNFYHNGYSQDCHIITWMADVTNILEFRLWMWQSLEMHNFMKRMDTQRCTTDSEPAGTSFSIR
jgi:hypothetical protein